MSERKHWRRRRQLGELEIKSGVGVHALSRLDEHVRSRLASSLCRRLAPDGGTIVLNGDV